MKDSKEWEAVLRVREEEGTNADGNVACNVVPCSRGKEHRVKSGVRRFSRGTSRAKEGYLLTRDQGRLQP